MTGLDMPARHDLAERVDADLKRGERETGFDFFDSDDRFTVTTYSPSIVRSLLKHSEARINWIYATGDADATGRVTNLSRIVGSEAAVEGVQATLPKGCLTVKGTVRASNKDSGIVNTPDDAEEAREAFADDSQVEA